MGVGFHPTSRFPTSSQCRSRWNGVGRQVKAIRLTQHDIPLRGLKEIQCGATFGHALARISPSRVRPPVACAYAIREFS